MYSIIETAASAIFAGRRITSVAIRARSVSLRRNGTPETFRL
jgi:hypothetical protein